MTTPTNEGSLPPAAPAESAPPHRPSRLNQALAWVGITAGGLFVVASIFFSGYFLSWTVDGPHHAATTKMDCCADMKAGDHMAQGQMMPGMTMGPGATMGPAPQSPPPTPRR